MPVVPFEQWVPRLADDVFVAPGAWIVGDVEIGAQSSVWFQAVVRGDVHPVRIAERCNIQDGCIIHVTRGRHATHLEHDVTVGHGAILHGCYIEHHVLVGIGARILDAARIGAYTLVGAGTLVPPGKTYPSGVLLIGSPARVARELTDEERRHLEYSSENYVTLAERYRTADQLPGDPPP